MIKLTTVHTLLSCIFSVLDKVYNLTVIEEGAFRDLIHLQRMYITTLIITSFLCCLDFCFGADTFGEPRSSLLFQSPFFICLVHL